MAYQSFCVFVTTNISTHLALLSEDDESVIGFKDKICVEHERCFASLGKIEISAVKIKHGDVFYLLPDSVPLKKVFQGMIGSKHLFLYVDVVRTQDNSSELLKVPESDVETLKPNDSENQSRKRKLVTSDNVSSGQEVAAIDKGDLVTNEVYQFVEASKTETDDISMKEEKSVDGEAVVSFEKPKKKRSKKKRTKIEAKENIQVVAAQDNVEPTKENIQVVAAQDNVEPTKENIQVVAAQDNVEPTVVIEEDPMPNLDSIVINEPLQNSDNVVELS